MRQASFPSMIATLVLAGCGGVAAAYEDIHEYEDTVRELEGQVDADAWSGAPLIVVLLRDQEREGAPPLLQDRVVAYRPGPFRFLVRPGRYKLGAFEDTNGNQRLDTGERVGAYQGFEWFELAADESRQRMNLTVSRRQARELPVAVDRSGMAYMQNVGTVKSLDEPRFEPDNGPLGMWTPIQFMSDPGPGLFFLEEYDTEKTPVLFVHGISGHPREFTTYIESLDRERFQPWVLQYASGMRLDATAEILNRYLNELHRRHSFRGLCIVAHSMGGVVSRRFLALHRENSPAQFVRMLLTIDSPLGGMESAQMGSEMSPLVVPAWRDLGPESELIRSVYGTRLPDGMEYVLFFAHEGTTPTDGTVELVSQLRPEAMAEAVRMWGFVETHTGMLRNARVVERLRTELDRCRELEHP